MPTNEELIKKLSKDLRDYIEDRIGSVIDLVINQAETVDRTRRDADALATKLRDVTAALVQADGAILLDLQDLRTFVMNSAFGPDPSATQPEEYEAELLGVPHIPGAVQQGHFQDFGRGLEWVPESDWHLPSADPQLSFWQWIKLHLGLPIF